MSERTKFTKKALSYYGVKQGSAKHKTLIDVFNQHKPDGWAMTYTAPWCATFVSSIAYICNVSNAVPLSANCNTMIRKAKTMGIWKESDSFVPSAGDLIFYDWQDDGKGDNKGSADHVGIVVSCDGKTIKVIEGNKSKKVDYRTIKVDGRYIRGFAVPCFAGEKKTTAAKASAKKTDPETIKQKYKILSKTGMNVRKGPGTEYAVTGGANYGATFTASKKSGNWVYSKYYKGWICIKDDSNTYLKKV